MLQQLKLESRESFDYKQGYEFVIYEVHKQYSLRRKNNIEVPTKKLVQTQTKKIAEAPVTKVLQILPRGTQEASSPKIVDITLDETQTSAATQTIPNKRIERKTIDTKTESPNAGKQDKNTQTQITKDEVIQLGKTQMPFNFKIEIAKLKILVPLTELVKNESYKAQITETLDIGEGEDTVNLNDDQPELLFGPEVNGKHQQVGIPPFYISLNIHDKILHNVMLYSGASHNLMPKAVMERLNLDITRPYKDLFSFDSSQVKFLGLIKGLCVTLV